VTSVSPSAYPDRLAVPVDAMLPVDAAAFPELAG